MTDRTTSAKHGNSSGGAHQLTEVEGLVRGLVDVMRTGHVSELDLTLGELTLRLRTRQGGEPAASRGDAPPGVEYFDEPEPRAGGRVIKAPMIGTYYVAPSPSSPPYIHVGDVIAAGQVIGIIEAMKIMNEIAAEYDGVVAEILVANGEPVEFGTPLVRLEPHGARGR